MTTSSRNHKDITQALPKLQLAEPVRGPGHLQRAVEEDPSRWLQVLSGVHLADGREEQGGQAAYRFQCLPARPKEIMSQCTRLC